MDEVKKYRMMVYICSPYAGDIKKNTENAKRYCRWATDRGCIAIAPHLYFPQFMSEDTEREEALHSGIVLLGKCDEVWVFGDRISEGMRAEIEKAEKFRKRIRHFSDKEVQDELDNIHS